MFAVVQVGSSQFKVSEGDVIDADHSKEAIDGVIVLDKVLMFSSGTDVRIGKPYLKDVTITAKVADHVKGKKMVAFKYRRRKDSSTKVGFRRKITKLNITKIAV